MVDIVRRELIYLWYYFDIQFRQIAGYWVFGMLLGSATKITNLGAIKIVLGLKDFIFYLAFTILFALLSGFVIDKCKVF
jgi:hypothetical protein